MNNVMESLNQMRGAESGGGVACGKGEPQVDAAETFRQGLNPRGRGTSHGHANVRWGKDLRRHPLPHLRVPEGLSTSHTITTRFVSAPKIIRKAAAPCRNIGLDPASNASDTYHQYGRYHTLAGNMEFKMDIRVLHDLGPRGAVILRPVGSLDVKALAVFEKALKDALDSNPKAILMDFSGVTFFSSSAVGVLLQCLAELHTDGGLLVLFGVKTNERTVLDLVGLSSMLAIKDTEQDALSTRALQGLCCEHGRDEEKVVPGAFEHVRGSDGFERISPLAQHGISKRRIWLCNDEKSQGNGAGFKFTGARRWC